MDTSKTSIEPNKVSVLFQLGIFTPLLHALWRPRVIGRENMPKKGPCFVYGNHGMYMDPFVLNILIGPDVTAGVMAREFMRKGIYAYFMRSIGILPVNRDDASVVRAIFRLIAAERKVLIYPEGGRRWAGQPLPWIMSTLKLYRKAGIPIYGVATHGSYVAWPRWATYPRPARLKVEFLPPVVLPRDTSDEEALRILETPVAFDENIVPDDIKPRWAYRPAAGIHILLYRDPVTGENAGIFTPDGTRVNNREGSLRLVMQPDSTLIDPATGVLHTTGALYDRVRSIPQQKEPDGALISNRVEVRFSKEFPTWSSLGTGHASLHEDAIRVTGTSEGTQTYPFENARYAQIERNWKLQMTFTSGSTLELGFKHGGSALQWLDLISDMGVRRI